MGSESGFSFPVIDFSKEDLKPGSGEWETVKSQVYKALEEFGCFEAIFNKVPSDLKKGFFDSIDELFQLPSETKLKTVTGKPFHGYFRDPRYYESMCIDEANIPQNMDSFTSTLWPQGNPNFSKNVLSVSNRVLELSQMVRMMVVESLGLEKYAEEHLNSMKYILKVMKYEGPQTPEAKLGLPAHYDNNFLTILSQNQIDGLEVKTKNGEWIQCNPSPDSFVVLVGYSFNAWTNGRLYPPFHRVMMRGNQARYSASLCCFPKQGYIIKAPEELIDEEHPLLFKPYDFMEFLKFYRTEAGQRSEFALRTYCGL